jgi:threonylcarbamoyladenosine tRNA methylthiotransferase MtaB
MTTENSKQKTENRRFRIVTFGCKINQCDTAGLSHELTRLGWQAAPPGAAPDLILVNTCTVTSRADQQARQAIRRLGREYPGAPIWVTGCYAQRSPQDLAALPGVAAVLGNQEKFYLTEIINELPWNRPNIPAASSLPPSSCKEDRERRGVQSIVGAYPATPPFHPWQVQSFPGHTRAMLKIQEGCSHHCTYCIVPQVRGPRRSWPPAEVAAALSKLAAAGYQEVVLTGIDLGQYGQDLDPAGSLAGLVGLLNRGPLPFRVRLSSLEPQEVTGGLLTELAAWRAFCPHFHLPLQSGAAPVLKAMNRPYQPGEFHDLVLEISRFFPDAALGLDVLVGFPGETATDFEATRNLVAALPATYLHVFPYSPRPGTPAAALKPLPGREVQRRARLLRDLGLLKKHDFLRSQLARVREVLVEGPAPQRGWLRGLSDNYLRVVFPGPAGWRNRRFLVRLLDLQGEALLGEVIAAL